MPITHPAARREAPLAQLAPAECESGGRFHGGPTCTLRVPVHYPPQKVLHWLMQSSLASLDGEFAKELLRGMIELGADPLRLTPARQLPGIDFDLQRRLTRYRPRTYASHSEQARTDLEHFNVDQVSPMGGVLLVGNASALHVLASVMAEGEERPDLGSTVARLARPLTAPKDHDVWALCARLRQWEHLPSLDVAFGTGWRLGDAHSSEFGPRELRLGAALQLLLVDGDPEQTRLASLEHVDSTIARGVIEFLRHGAAPSMVDLRAAKVDPGLVVSIVCASDVLADDETAQLVERLVDLDFPLDPQRRGNEPPLHAAANRSKALTVIRLLEAGAQPLATNAEGQTLEQCVLQRRDQAVLQAMRAWAARKLALDTVGGLSTFCAKWVP